LVYFVDPSTSTERKGILLEPLPDLGSLSDDDLKKEIDQLKEQEREISYQRRILHGKIDILRAELVARLQKTGGQSVLDSVDVESLTAILAGKATPPDQGDS
jgi:hypothetical protein